MNINAIKKNIKQRVNNIESSPVGSVCTTVAILNGKEQTEAERLFALAKKNLKGDFTFRKLFKTLWKESNNCPGMVALVPNVILLSDDKQVYSPIVTYMYQDAAMPLNPNGVQAPLIKAFNDERDFVIAEPLFDTYDDFESEETLW